MTTPLSLFVTGLIVSMMYSFLYKDNPFYKFAEAILIGTAAGYMTITGLQSLWKTSLFTLIQGDIIQIIPIILTILLFATFIPKVKWLTRIPTTIMIITGLSITAAGSVPSVFVAQTVDSFTSLINLKGVIVVVGALSTLFYFVFFTEHKGGIGGFSRLGRLFLITGLGAQYGYFVTTRITRWISSLTLYLLVEPAYYAVVPVVIGIVAWEFWNRSLSRARSTV